MGFTFQTTDARTKGTVPSAYTYITVMSLDAVQGQGAFTFLSYWDKAARDAGKQPIPPGQITVAVPQQPQAEVKNDDGSVKTPATASLSQFIAANAAAYGAIREAIYRHCVDHPRSMLIQVLGESVDPSQASVSLIEDAGSVLGISFTVPDPNKVGDLTVFARVGGLAVEFYKAAGIGFACYESREAFDAGGAMLPVKARCQMTRDDTPAEVDQDGNEVTPAAPGLMTFLAANAEPFNSLRTAAYNHAKPHLEAADFITNLVED